MLVKETHCRHAEKRPRYGRFSHPRPSIWSGVQAPVETRIRFVRAGSRSLYVNTADPTLGIACPRCSLLTARFSQYCLNCGYRLWPSAAVAAKAFQTWQEADPVARSKVRVFDTDYPVEIGPPVVDYEARAHELGIHVFPNSPNPFVICVGVFFAMLAIAPFAPVARIILGVIGVLLLLWGVIGWVVREDVKIYDETARSEHGAAH